MKQTIILIFGLVMFSGVSLNSHNEVSLPFNTVKESNTISMDVTATMYNAVVSQCDSDPLITAGMYKINPNKASEQKFIAMSRDLLKRWGGVFDYGDKVLIEGTNNGKDGVYTVADSMNKRYKKRIDILETKGKKFYKFDKVKITKI